MPGNRGSATAVSIYFFRLLTAFVCFWVVADAWAQQASVRSELSASTITRDETVVLTITAVGIDAELDASSLDRDFDVVGRSSSREVRMISNGNNQITNTSVVTWALELLPKDIGVFTVPAVKVGDLSTQLLSLTVNEVPQGAKREIFIEATVDTVEPWVQSQVVMTVSIFQAVDIVDGGLDVPSTDDLIVQRMGEDTRSRQVRDGREYSVTERRFALFAQKSGVLELKPITLSVTVPADPNRVRGFFSPTRKLTRRTKALSLNVLPRPDTGSGWWLPAKRVLLDSQWAKSTDDAQVDKPLTRTIVLRAEGVQDSQLPEISIPAIDGVSLYAEEPQRTSVATADGLVAEQKINWALIPQRAGVITLPAITVNWFNTQTGKSEIALLPEEQIEIVDNAVAGGTAGNTANLSQQSDNANSVASSQPLPDESDSMSAALIESDQNVETSVVNEATAITGADLTDADEQTSRSVSGLTRRIDNLESSLANWRFLAFLTTALWFATGLYFIVNRRWRSSRSADDSTGVLTGSKPGMRDGLAGRVAPFSALEKACAAGELKAIKTALLQWSNQQWPDDPPATLQALSGRLPEGSARNTIIELDSQLYGQTSNPDRLFNKAVGSLSSDLKSAVNSKLNAVISDSALKRRGASALPEL